ncbi:hypothetical protein DL765_009843 [Monosporascus sp. GIB2]|nr:hypothetical protein DL765_009843 [Monosporascus sp. GIB2]
MVSFKLVALLAAQQLLPSVATAAGELCDDPVVVGAYIAEFEGGDADSFYDELKTLGISAKSRVDFNSKLFRGVSFDLGIDSGAVDEEAEKISRLATVINIWPIYQHSTPEVDVLWTGNDTDLSPTVHKRDGEYTEASDTHLMTQIDKLKAEGYTGRGIMVAVVDTGIDYMQPALGGCFGEASALISLVTGSEMVPLPERGLRHETHVAGIIAAQGTKFTGAATGVQPGAYRVFGCRGHTTTDVSAAGLLQALASSLLPLPAQMAGLRTSGLHSRSESSRLALP